MMICVLFTFLFVMSCGDGEGPTPQPMTKPTVNLTELAVVEGDQVKSIFVSIQLTESPTEPVSVTLETLDQSAKADEDFRLVDETIDFSVGSSQGNIKIEIIGDEEQESDEFFTLKIASVSGATLGTGSVSITIENDDFTTSLCLVQATATKRQHNLMREHVGSA